MATGRIDCLSHTASTLYYSICSEKRPCTILLTAEEFLWLERSFYFVEVVSMQCIGLTLQLTVD